MLTECKGQNIYSNKHMKNTLYKGLVEKFKEKIENADYEEIKQYFVFIQTRTEEN